MRFPMLAGGTLFVLVLAAACTPEPPADADTVILGSYAKLGDTIRISYKIQEASTGEILEANPAFAAMLGLSSAEAVTRRSFTEFFAQHSVAVGGDQQIILDADAAEAAELLHGVVVPARQAYSH